MILIRLGTDGFACIGWLWRQEGSLQQLSRIGMARILEDRLGLALLHHLAVPDHHQLMTQGLDHGQVVADEQIGQAILALQRAQQLDDLTLHGAVQGRGRLVEQDQRRLEHQRAGDGDALALAAGKLVRVPVAGIRIQTDLLERRDDRGLLFRGCTDTVDAQAFGDDLGHAHARTEAAEGVLEDYLHLPAQGTYLVLVHGFQAFSLEANGPLAGDQTQYCQPERRLARSTFADDAQGLAPRQAEIDPVHRLDVVHGTPEETLADGKPHA